ncbi:GNAT family N-acetyltransferase [Vibrio mimicus]|nr:N-acetyltransferase [Vibrio vulnificus]
MIIIEGKPSEIQVAEINEIRRQFADIPNSVLKRYEPMSVDNWNYVKACFFYKEDSLLGYSALRWRPFSKVRDEIELDVFVMPKYQKSGIGQSLIRRLLVEAKSIKTVKSVVIMVKAELNLSDYYRQFGFKSCSDGNNSHLMMKYNLERI